MALIAVAADKGAPGVTTASVALAAVWPRPVLLAECDPAGGDIVYRLPGVGGTRLDPRRGLLSLAVAARHGLRPHQVWEHTQKLYGGLDVLAGVTSAEQGAGLDALWAVVGGLLSRIPDADVIADCGRIGVDGSHYDLLAEADAVVLITRASLAEVVRLRDRAMAVTNALHRRGRPGARIGVVVIADHRNFKTDIAEVGQAIGQGKGPASVIGGLAYEPKSADQLRGQWGGKLDKSLLIRTAREIAGYLSAQLAQAQLPAAQPAPAQPSRQELTGQEFTGQGSAPQGSAAPQSRPGPGAGRDLTGRDPAPFTGSGGPGPESAPPRSPGATGQHPVLPEMPWAGLAEPMGPVTPAADPLYAAPVPDAPLPEPSPRPGRGPRGRHAGPPAAPAVGTERPHAGTGRQAPDRAGSLLDPPSATVSGGPAAPPGDPGGW